MTVLLPLDAEVLVGFQDSLLFHLKQGKPSPRLHETALWLAIADNHRYNIALWDEEDQARRRDVNDSAIANSKRLIDGHNQRRNDAIERIDEQLLACLPQAPESACLHSETAGAMVDRLSILALKIFHMEWQTRRADADLSHHELSRARLARLIEQRSDLVMCLDGLLQDCIAGTRRFKVYRQFKMYNDPKFNPFLAASGNPST